MTTEKQSGKTIDIVDTMTDAEIQRSMKEMKKSTSSSTKGTIVGAFAGAALGVGGIYAYNKKQEPKRAATTAN